MNKLYIICTGVLISVSAHAQSENKAAIPITSPGASTTRFKGPRECYMMKEGTLMHCSGTTMQPQQTNVTLKNGTIITILGELIRKNNTRENLVDNQCILLNGKICDCNRLYENHKKE